MSTPKGLFDQDALKLKKRKPGKVSAPKVSESQDVSVCGRSIDSGKICMSLPLNGQCYPVPYGHNSHAFVTPCEAHAAEVASLVRSVYVSWTESTREALGQLHEFLTEKYPWVIEKHRKNNLTGDHR